MLAACGPNDKEKVKISTEPDANFNAEGYPIVDEPVTISMFGTKVGQTDWKEMAFFKAMEEKTNIKFDFRTPNLDSLATQKNLMFASGDYSEILFAADLSNEEQIKNGGQGTLIPLEDLIEKYAPNIKKMFEEHPDVKKGITARDGHIYALPQVAKGDNWYRGPLWYNNTFLEALEVTELPETTDELYELLKRMRDEDPNGNGKADEIPLTANGMDDIRQFFLGAFGVLDSSTGAYAVDGEVKYSRMQPGYKAYLEYMKMLYDEKLFDSESFSQTSEQKKGKGVDNRIGLFADWFPFFTLGTPVDGTENPMMKPITSDLVEVPTIPMSEGISPGAFAITDINKNPAASIRWVDYLYSEEGYTLFNKGPEGILWDFANEEKTIRKQNEKPTEFISAEDWRGSLTPDYGIATPKLAFDLEWAGESEFPDWVREETVEKIHSVGHVPLPQLFVTADEQKEINRIRTDLDPYVLQMEAKFISGAEPMENWDKYVETIKKMKVDRLVELYNDAYQSYLSN
ncbi:extracellular solute-binding protein [Sporosarcina sp. ANT_H38]|nr:extracellular solute-binding protein [Sporosarcina sp. ANT_H38]